MTALVLLGIGCSDNGGGDDDGANPPVTTATVNPPTSSPTTTPGSTTVPGSLAAFVPADATVIDAFTRTEDDRRNDSVTVRVTDRDLEAQASGFRALALAAGWVEAADVRDGEARVLAYTKPGDQSLAIRLTIEATGTFAVIALLAP